MQLSVIIVSYNVKYFLEQCLHSVARAMEGIEGEVLIEDNASTDGSRAYLEPKFPSVKFNWSATNDGFGKANNRALIKSRGDYILFLNPDTIVAEDCFFSCLNFFKNTADCGALGVRMIDGSGVFLKESKRGLPSPQASFFKMAGLGKLFPTSKKFAAYHAGHLPENKTNKTAVLAGAFMMMDRIAIEKTGGFDEAFFMYGEDIDLCYRVTQAGFDNYYFPGTSIIHFKGESTQRLSLHYIRHFYGAMQLFVNKHYRDKKLIFYSMQMAIWLNKMMATGKLALTKGSTKNSLVTPLETVVIGSDHTFNTIIDLLKYAHPPVILRGRIAISDKEDKVSLGVIANLKEVIVQHKLDQLIYCESDLSFKSIISGVEQNGKLARCLIHAFNSESIVGSNEKNAKGVFIAASA